MKKIRSKKKFIINIIAIGLMLTGPVLMILPGPQILSWVGLFMFLWNNKEITTRWLWSYYLMCYTEFKIDRLKSKIKRKSRKNDKN